MIPLALPEPDVAARAHSDRLLALIRGEIAGSGGFIPFSRYMELCLYAPGLGYYSAGATKFGEAGDFVTAPELGALFARTVAAAIAPILVQLGPASGVFELGGGSGVFARDALLALAALDAEPSHYRILEPSADLRERQKSLLNAQLPNSLFRRVEWLDGLPEQTWVGVLFANEVLDALPTPRFAIIDGEVFEEGVALGAEGQLVSCERPADDMLTWAVRRLERSRGQVFANGYRSELLVQLPWWMKAVTDTHEAGLALFVDYGYPRREFYLTERNQGTLMCHYRHRAHADPFFLPGLCDITASVDFTAVAEAGAAAGYELAGFSAQAAFLLGNGLDRQLAAATAGCDERSVRQLNDQVRRLTLPGEMGERFKVIGLQRGVEAESLFAFADQSHRL